MIDSISLSSFPSRDSSSSSRRIAGEVALSPSILPPIILLCRLSPFVIFCLCRLPALSDSATTRTGSPSLSSSIMARVKDGSGECESTVKVRNGSRRTPKRAPDVAEKVNEEEPIEASETEAAVNQEEDVSKSNGSDEEGEVNNSN